MRFVVVADIHYALQQYDWLLKVAPHYDAVVIAGDLLELSSMVDRRAQIIVLRNYLAKLSKQTNVIVCSGNHDLDGEGLGGERTATWISDIGIGNAVSDGNSLYLSGVRFSSLPWWDGPVSKQLIQNQLEHDAKLNHETWVWVYHAPPADNPVSWAGQRHFGDSQLNAWIADFKPDLVLSGHVHQSPFVQKGSWIDRIDSTWVFNTGQQIGPHPTHIAIALDLNIAVWFASTGGQTQSLNAQAADPTPLLQLPDWVKL
jgi:Icc-related predicted phosphoesterase